jgi:hypothetical protein
MKVVGRQETEHDFAGVPVEPISNPELGAVGIRIFRPLPPKKDAEPEDHET